MKTRSTLFLVGVAAALTLSTVAAQAVTPVTNTDLTEARAHPSEWLMYGHTYNNWRYSKLDQISTKNVTQLTPVWTISTGGKFQGLEATPLYHDGVLYFTADDARVFAVNALTGKVIWRYVPQYSSHLNAELCCGAVNRGVALKGDLVYVATTDAHLVALNAATGKVVWNKEIQDWKDGATETLAPLVVGNHVIVGISSGEYGGRGYLKAYDTTSGKLQWTMYTVPGPGAGPKVNSAKDTWEDNSWKHGGGPTWVTGSYDVKTNTLYWGVGNPGPWASTSRKGKNLYTDSLLAIDPDNGTIKAAYQYTPNDSWDYDGMGGAILAKATYKGSVRDVAVEANRNGFLYVLNRKDLSFLYAVPMIKDINWTLGLNPKTGEPVINPAMKPTVPGKKVGLIVPALEGGTNWFPPSYDPALHYVFVNANHWGMTMTMQEKKIYPYVPGNTFMGETYQVYRMGNDIGHTEAFDLETGKFVWDTPNHLPLFSGLLSTAGGLVFTGGQDGNLMAMDAKTGRILWQFQTGSGINASPITYEADGTQYVAILSGVGGDMQFYSKGPHGGMLWVFALHGKGAQQPSNAINMEVNKEGLRTWHGKPR